MHDMEKEGGEVPGGLSDVIGAGSIDIEYRSGRCRGGVAEQAKS